MTLTRKYNHTSLWLIVTAKCIQLGFVSSFLLPKRKELQMLFKSVVSFKSILLATNINSYSAVTKFQFNESNFPLYLKATVPLSKSMNEKYYNISHNAR